MGFAWMFVCVSRNLVTCVFFYLFHSMKICKLTNLKQYVDGNKPSRVPGGVPERLLW